jgi:hypothetical protein
MGPEASGTRYVTALIQASDWTEGNVIVRRSVPFDRRFVPLDETMEEVDRNDTRVIVCARRADVLTLSAVQNGHSRDWREALIQQQRAYVWTMGECARLMVPFLLTSYESFTDPNYRTWVCDWALDSSDHGAAIAFGFTDGNEKYL